MSLHRFNLPDLGEGLPDAEIVRWLVGVGESVTVNQPLVEVETAKAVVEVPSPFAGVVAECHCSPGQTVPVGATLISIEANGVGGDGGARGADEAGDGATASPPVNGERVEGERADGERVEVLVGYGPRPGGGRRGRRGAGAAVAESVPASPPPGRGAPSRPAEPALAAAAATARATNPAAGPPTDPAPGAGAAGQMTATAAGVSVLAKPPVRKLARDLGVDLRTVTGTGPHGTISRADVQAARGRAGHPTPASPAAASPAAVLPGTPGLAMTDAEITRVPVNGVRRAMADAMTASAFTAPHASLFATVDLTETMAARTALAAMPEFAGMKLTPLLFTARALLAAIRRNPMVNSRWEDGPDGTAEIVVSRTVNLGIAVDSPRGLVVPVIADAGSLTLPELARRLGEVVAAAREGRLAPAAMRGGTITITNIGTFGVDVGTPIINPPEAAILALGAVRPAPWVHEGELAVRDVGQLVLAFDHRIIDGALGARVLGDVTRMLADPLVGLAWS